MMCELSYQPDSQFHEPLFSCLLLFFSKVEPPELPGHLANENRSGCTVFRQRQACLPARQKWPFFRQAAEVHAKSLIVKNLHSMLDSPCIVTTD